MLGLRSALSAMFLATAVVAAACGSDGGAGPSEAPPVGDTVADSTTATPPATTGAPTTATQTTGTPTTQPPDTTEPPPSTTAVFMPACSATGMDQPEPSDVPDAVAATRDLIIGLALNCDYDGLAALAGDSTGLFTYSFGGGDDPAGHWREAEDRGDEVMAALVTVLGMSYGTLEAITDDETVPLYFWPAAFGGEATEEDWKEVAELYSAAEIASMREFGGYIGYRVGITGTGDWMFFVAGD